MFTTKNISKSKTTLISKILDAIHNCNGSIKNIDIVMPNKNTYFNLRYKLNRNNTNFIIKTFTLEQFFQNLSNSILEKDINLIYKLFLINEKYLKSNESFEKFYSWGTTLLKDFNDIDGNFVDPDKLFLTIKNQKELDEQFKFLDEPQKLLIKEFWKTIPTDLLTNKQNIISESSQSKEINITKQFFKIWEVLPKIYKTFNEEITQKNRISKGLLYKRLLNKIEENKIIYKSDFIILAGFSILNKAEIKTFSYLLNNYNTKIIWDIDQYYLEQRNHPINVIFHNYNKRLWNIDDLEQKVPVNKIINIAECNSDIDQIDLISNIILDIKSARNDTAIIIPDEKKIKMLTNIFDKKNIQYQTSINFKLKFANIYRLFIEIVKVKIKLNSQFNVTIDINNSDSFIGENEIKNIILFFKDNIYVKEYLDEKINPEGVNLINEILNTHKSFFKLVLDFFDIIKSKSIYYANNEIEKQALRIVEEVLQKFSKLYESSLQEFIPSLEFINLFEKLVFLNKNDFEEQNENAIQILGFQESQCSTFENIFVLFANETTLPPKDTIQSFIPYNIKKAFQLPTYFTHQSKYYSYLFFRLLHNSSNFYVTYSNNNIKGISEPSPFILALLHDNNITKNYIDLKKYLSRQENIITPHINDNIIKIEKSEEVFNQLKNSKVFQKGISPTSLNTYLDCSLKFYLKYIRNLEKNIENSDEMFFGKIFHSTMEMIYKNEKIITKELIDQKLRNVENITKKTIKDLVNIEQIGGNTLKKLPILENLVNKFVEKILFEDKKYVPFEIIGIELGKNNNELKKEITLNSKTSIILKGLIDRVDKKDNTIRIIDYKTGNFKTNFYDIKNLFKKDDPNRNKIALQLIFYSYLYYNGESKNQLQPFIFGTKDLFKIEDNNRLKYKEDNKYIEINNILPYLNEFEVEVKNILEEIFDPKIPFVQTNQLKICEQCIYNKICNR